MPFRRRRPTSRNRPSRWWWHRDRRRRIAQVRIGAARARGAGADDDGTSCRRTARGGAAGVGVAGGRVGRPGGRHVRTTAAQPAGVGAARAPPGAVAEEGRLPEEERLRAAGGTVLCHGLDGQHPDEQLGGAGRIRRRRRGEDERRRRPVDLADAPQPPQDLRDVRAEDAAVAVALVDDHEPQRPQEAGPAVVRREHRVVQHVRVGEQVRRMRAGHVAQLDRGVAVVRRRHDAGDAQVVERAQLVRCQRLGRRDVQRRAAEAPSRTGRRQRRQLIGERLPRRGTGGDDDVPTGPGQSSGLCLMGPGRYDASGHEAIAHDGIHPDRPRAGLGGPGGDRFDVRDTSGPVRTGQQDIEQVVRAGHLVSLASWLNADEPGTR